MNLNFSQKNLYPFTIIDPEGTVIHRGCFNEKAWNKTLENGVLWEYIEENGRVLEKNFALLTLNPAGAVLKDDIVTISLEHHDKKSENSDESQGYAFLGELEKLLRDRKKQMPENSYTTHLFTKGEEKILKKLGEETIEVILAAAKKDEGETIYEAADLIYHLMVLFVEKDLPFKAVIEELEKRMSK